MYIFAFFQTIQRFPEKKNPIEYSPTKRRCINSSSISDNKADIQISSLIGKLKYSSNDGGLGYE